MQRLLHDGENVALAHDGDLVAIHLHLRAGIFEGKQRLSGEIMIEPMQEKDLDQVIALEQELFTSPWTREAFLYELQENPYSYNAVIRKEGKVVAYCGLWCLFDQAQITNIAVARSWQRKHLASALMAWMEQTAAEKGCETLSLEVRVSNEAAKALYWRCGFEKISVRKGYYQDNHEDALLMMKAIGGWQ